MLLVARAEFLEDKISGIDLFRNLWSDPDSNSPVRIAPEMFGETLNTIVAGAAAAPAKSYLTEFDVYLIVDHDHLLNAELVKMKDRLCSLAAQVHKCLGLAQNHAEAESTTDLGSFNKERHYRTPRLLDLVQEG